MRFLATTSIVCVAVAAIAARQQVPRFKSGVEIVELDVSAVDKDGRSVRGLTAPDFTVFEDGDPQTLVQFTAVDIPDPPAVTAPWQRDVAPDVTDNHIADRRLFVIVLDDAMAPADLATTKATKEMARSLVNRLGPQDLASIVFTLNNTHAQSFTSDRASLLGAIDTFSPGPAGMIGTPAPVVAGGRGQVSGSFLPDRDSAMYFPLASVGTLRNIADLLTAVPHQRKILMYISVGMAVPINTADPLLEMMKDLFRYARSANVNVYTFDPKGLGDEPLDFLRVAASQTGGRASVATNDVDRGVTEMLRENSSYYLLAYQSTHPKKDGQFRKLDVRVNRSGVTVRTRSGYDAPRAEKASASTRPAPPVATEVAGLPNGDVQMQVAVAPFAITGKNEAALAIAADVHQTPPTERAVNSIELKTNAYGPEGELRGSQRQLAKVLMRPAPGETDAQFEVLSRMDVKPGHYNLRVEASSTMRDKPGSVYYALDVPDFAKDALSLSGVVLSATPAEASAGKDALTSLIPVMPTTQREFAKSDAVVAFLRVYQHAKGALEPVQFDVRIVDGHDAVKFHAGETFAADRFVATRAVDYRLDLWLAGLAPGAHLLTIEATAGKTAARRDVRFVMK